MSEYSYSGGDNIQEPQSYMYSSTGLAQYAEARAAFRRICLERVNRGRQTTTVRESMELVVEELPSGCRKLFPEVRQRRPEVTEIARCAKRIRAVERAEYFDTEGLLKDLLHLALEKTVHPEAERLWMMFQRRFEVQKRVWTRYSRDFKPASDDFRQVGLYALLAGGFGLRARQTHDVRTLNVLLKINDTISSVAADLPPSDYWVWALLALECERSAFLEYCRG